MAFPNFGKEKLHNEQQYERQPGQHKGPNGPGLGRAALTARQVPAGHGGSGGQEKG
jgi:hypothetical protein